MPEITDEQIDDCMREAGMEEIEEADYRHGQGEQMTISEQERLDAARKFARLVLSIRPSGRKEECCILKVAATRDGMKCSRGVLGCVAVHDEEMPAASAAQGQWQPIETAPKDGKHVLLAYAPDEVHEDGFVSQGYWMEEDHDGPDNMGHDAGFVDVHFQFFSCARSFGAEAYRSAGLQPTHWMPLPSAPGYPPPPTEEPVDRDAALQEAAKACKSLSERRGFTKDQRQMADKCAAVILAMRDGTGENHGT